MPATVSAPSLSLRPDSWNLNTIRPPLVSHRYLATGSVSENTVVNVKLNYYRIVLVDSNSHESRVSQNARGTEVGCDTSPRSASLVCFWKTSLTMAARSRVLALVRWPLSSGWSQAITP